MIMEAVKWCFGLLDNQRCASVRLQMGKAARVIVGLAGSPQLCQK